MKLRTRFIWIRRGIQYWLLWRRYSAISIYNSFKFRSNLELQNFQERFGTRDFVQNPLYLRFEVAIVMTIESVFWYMTPYNLVDMCECIWETCCLYFRDRNVIIFFYPVDGDSKFIHKVYMHLPNYTASHSRRQCRAFVKRPFYFIVYLIKTASVL